MRRVVRAVLLLSLLAPFLPASDVNGIWSGLAPGRNNTKQDVAFRFEMKGKLLTGVLFGDEFDLPIEDASFTANSLHFSVTTTNYYSGAKAKFAYAGTVTGDSIELTRERILKPGEKAPEKESLKETFTLRKLVP